MKLRRGAGIISATTVLLAPAAAFAQTALSKPLVPCDGVNCSVCDLALLAQNLLNVGVYILIAIAAIMFAWAGFEMLTSQGSSAKYGLAKRIFGNVMIGLIILLISWVVIDTVMKTFVKEDTRFGPWNQVCYRGGGGAAP